MSGHLDFPLGSAIRTRGTLNKVVSPLENEEAGPGGLKTFIVGMSWVSVPFSSGFISKYPLGGEGQTDGHRPCESLLDWLSGLTPFPPTPLALESNTATPQLQATSKGHSPACPQWLSIRLKLPSAGIGGCDAQPVLSIRLMPPCALKKTCPNLGLLRRETVPALC